VPVRKATIRVLAVTLVPLSVIPRARTPDVTPVTVRVNAAMDAVTTAVVSSAPDSKLALIGGSELEPVT
jgi:hypothetical protein